ncbi:MAG: hypothetical protein ABH864_04365, partial [archaeon]
GKHGVPCNQYNCESLGYECEFMRLNEGVEDDELPLCVAVEYNDLNGPKIKELMDVALVEGFEYSNVQGLGTESATFEIEKRTADDGCVNQFGNIQFGFTLDEPGECGFSYEPDKEFEEMFLLGTPGLKYNHLVALGNLWEQLEPGSNDTQTLEVYLRCKDLQIDEDRGGNIGGENVLTFCVNPIDLTAPFVVGTNVEEGQILPYNQENVTLIVTFDEDVESARLDFEDVEYDEMRYEMRCSGNVCIVEVPLELGGNQFYVKAIDMQGNEMGGGHPINVERSESPLEIVSVEYDGAELNGTTIIRGGIVNALEVVVETDGGVDGTADCAYKLPTHGEAFFDETGSGVTNIHKQLFTSMINGEHRMEISCTDSAGNNALVKISFTIESDIVGPGITRVYDNSGTLVVITDEDATCAYTNEATCNFEIDEGQMMDGSEMIHTTALEDGVTYYIKCKDSFDNVPSGCSIIVSGGEF